MKIKKKAVATILVIVALCVVVGVVSWGVARQIRADGGFVSRVANRVNITVDKTNFTVKYDENDKNIGASFNVSIEKTEPDFYCLLDSITVEGAEFNTLLYTAGEKNNSSALPDKILLGADENGAINYSWDIAFSMNREKRGTTKNLTLKIVYESGINKDNVIKHEETIPITLTVE